MKGMTWLIFLSVQVYCVLIFVWLFSDEEIVNKQILESIIHYMTFGIPVLVVIQRYIEKKITKSKGAKVGTPK